ncbi:MAG TPA: PIN domain-containing protein [Thermomicrobiaceae bacterium]|nr:PIN domain-containing protein [Thermomicrobiaceae bacterium]
MSGVSGSGRRVFVDTSAYFAAVNTRDADHADVSALLRALVAERLRLITTNFVLAEVHALLLNRVSRAVALSALRAIEASDLTTIVRVAQRDEQRARTILAQYDDKDFSLTDATSFAVMERLGIARAFTLDRNFAQYGWDVIRPA